MDIRTYLPVDRNACLAIFDSNTPLFFDPSQRGGLELFLDHPDSRYFVMEHDGAIVGCGGFTTIELNSAKLVWGMIRSDFRGLGLGRFLLLYRLREIGKLDRIHSVLAETSERAAAFFERQGFRRATSGYATELNRVALLKKLTVCT